MKVLVRQNATTKTGYELVTIDEFGNESVQPIEKTGLEKKTNVNWLILPKNPTNRKLINPSKVDKLGEVELTYKASVTLGPRGENATPRKKLEEYLTDEEKAIIADLMAKAKARKELDKPKPLTEKEKLIRQIEKLQAKLDNYEEEE